MRLTLTWLFPRVLAFAVGFAGAVTLYLLGLFSYSSLNSYTSTTAIAVALLGLVMGALAVRALQLPQDRYRRRVFEIVFSAYFGLAIGLFAPALVSNPAWQNASAPQETSVSTQGQDSSEELWLPTIAELGAHAAGLYPPNSIDALEFQKDRFRVFELTFVRTADDEFVCRAESGLGGNPASTVPAGGALDENTLVPQASEEEAPACTLDTVSSWLLAHPSKEIVVRSEAEIAQIAAKSSQRSPELMSRLIFEAGSLSSVKELSAMGVERIFLKVGRGAVEAQDVEQLSNSYPLEALSVSASEFLRGEIEGLPSIPIYVDSVNQLESLPLVRSLGARGIYSDFIAGALP